VLNRRLETGIHLRRRGDVAEGWVVARGYKPIPELYLDRTIEELTLTFTDQFGKVYPERASAILERSADPKGKGVHGSRSQQSIGILQNAPCALRKPDDHGLRSVSSIF